MGMSEKKSKYKVLIYGAGGRQTLPICRGFFEIGCEVTVYCGSRLGTGYLTRFAHKKILYDKKNKGGVGFYEYGETFIKSGEYDIVVPLGDEGATYLSVNKKRLEKYCHIAVNDNEIFQYAIDKSKTMQVCMENGIPAPYTWSLDEINMDVVTPPVAVKPKTAVGSVGFNVFKDVESLKKYIESYDEKNGPLVIQQYVEQGKNPQYRADLFRDRNGQFKAGIVGKVTRWYPLDGGSGIYVETIHCNEILENCKKLLDLINWNGYANIDMVWDEREGKAKILEINGRTGASIMLDFVAGINISKLILENELGLDVSDMTDYDDGKKISCFLPDLLWLFKSPDRFSTKPSWFRRCGIKDTIFSWDDPLPSIVFLITSILSFKKAMNERRRIQ